MLPRLLTISIADMLQSGKPAIGAIDFSSVELSGPSRRRPVAFSFDAAYVVPLTIALRSLAEHNRNGWPLEIHLIVDQFPFAGWRKISDSLPPGSVSLFWHTFDMNQFGAITSRNVPASILGRFLVPQCFPDSVSRVLYLDCDILVLDDLESLWQTDLEDSIVAAVPDALDVLIKTGKAGLEDVPRVQCYFNAGVLLINLRAWRKEQVSERAVEFLFQHPQTPYADQDAINVVCDRRWKSLALRWNYQSHFRTYLSDVNPESRPGIVHFVTQSKPWYARSLSVNWSFYDSFRSRTCFARTPFERLSDEFIRTYARARRAAKRYRRIRSLYHHVMSLFRPGGIR